MKIGNINFKHGLFLAPMAGITDISFRKICKKYGAEGLFTEMISSRALCFDDKKTAELAKIIEDEHPIFLQIFGNSPDIMADAARRALRFSPDIIDINMGCPASKIAGNGDGSALMKNQKLTYEIVCSVKQSLMYTGIPLSVKIRSGFDKQHINAVEIATLCEKAGADCITVHGRTRDQMYAPPVNYEIIRNVKNAVSIPVIANGDICSGATAVKIKNFTGCDGLMVGRAALGNPYVFKEIICAIENIPYEKPKNEQILADITEHMTDLLKHKGEYIGSREARKHVAWYIKGLPGAAALRNKVNRLNSLEAVLEVAREAFSN